MGAINRPETIDWIARWRALVEGREAQGAALIGGDRPNVDFWEKRAPLFARFSGSLPDDDALLTYLRATVRPDDTVLDVGAGAGRYTLPLAGLARRVIAVEPSPGLRGHLEERLVTAGLTNVEVIAADWLGAPERGADLVLCSHVVYAIAEIEPFLRKLDREAQRSVVMACRVGQFRGPAELWLELYGTERVPEPTFIELYNVLYQLGLVAEVRLNRFTSRWVYTHPDEAVAEQRDRLLIQPGSPLETQLQHALQRRLIQQPDGLWTWPSPPTQAAILSWQKAEADPPTGH